MSKKILTVLLATWVVSFAAAGAEPPDVSKLPPPAAKKGLTYAKDIKPLLEQHCVKCHGPDKQKHNYRLDTLEAAVKGGNSGEAAIVPGKSVQSPLVHYIGHLVKDMEMPPPDKDGKTQKLSAEKISLIRTWIDEGAK